jgi:hypothetical protein
MKIPSDSVICIKSVYSSITAIKIIGIIKNEAKKFIFNKAKAIDSILCLHPSL